MSGPTSIEWTDRSWNPVTGCTKVSPGCKHCYAETLARRFNRSGPWTVQAQRQSGAPAVTLHPDRLEEPLRWRKPSRVFVNSMSDLFHEDVPDRFIFQVWSVIAHSPQHTFQILTKRPERAMRMMNAQSEGQEWLRRTSPDFMASAAPWPLPNIWLGVSVENQRYAEERIPLLLETPAAIRFISAEPLLGPLDLREWLCMEGTTCTDAPWLYHHVCPNNHLDWVICGGESGHQKTVRPMASQWARDLKNQCQQAGMPFFFKQWGVWMPTDQRDAHEGVYGAEQPDFVRLGKGRAGHYLDNQVFQQFPKVPYVQS